MRSILLNGPLARSSLMEILVGKAPQTGVIAEVDDIAFERLSFFAEAIGLIATEQLSDDRAVTAFTPETPDAPIWQAQNAAIIDHAAQEIIGYHGRVAASDLIVRRQMILARAWARHAAQKGAPTNLRSRTLAGDVEVHNNIATHEGYFLTRSYALRHPGFEGGMSAPLHREVFVATDAALVLPYDPVRDRVLLVEQFRMGPFGRGDPYPWVLEPVAGRVDAGEDPERTARRECLEEADLTLGALEHISSHYCTPGCSTEFFHCYLGLCDLPHTASSVGGLDTEQEDIRRHVIGFDDAMTLMRSGEVNIGPLYLMLLWLERERPRLRAPA